MFVKVSQCWRGSEGETNENKREQKNNNSQIFVSGSKCSKQIGTDKKEGGSEWLNYGYGLYVNS